MVVGSISSLHLARTCVANAIDVERIMSYGECRDLLIRVNEGNEILISHLFNFITTRANQIAVRDCSNSLVLWLHSFKHMAPDDAALREQVNSVIKCSTANMIDR